jgi:predicted secreted protein
LLAVLFAVLGVRSLRADARIARGLTGAAPRVMGARLIVVGTGLALFAAGFFVLLRLVAD